MKKIAILILFSIFTISINAQKLNADSLWQLVRTEKNDSVKFSLLYKLGNSIYFSVDDMLLYAKKEVVFGDMYNDKLCQAHGNFLYARVYNRIGNYVKGQEAIVKASIIVERLPGNGDFLALIYNAKGTGESDKSKGIEYLRKGIAVSKSEIITRVLFFNIAGNFLEQNKVDSALFYAQKSNEINIKIHDTVTVYLPNLFGRIYLKLNQPDLAYAYFKESLKRAERAKGFAYLKVAYSGLITFFTATNKIDSVLIYQKKLFAFQIPDAYPSKVEASQFIYEYYLKQGNKDSVIKYLLFNKQGVDSLKSTKKTEELKQAKITEELRETDLAKLKQEETENRNHNLQLAITAIAILSAIILFLLLSRSILVSHKVVEFLSVIVLLVVFEFINLLIHPWLEKITHHSPVLMLLGLVAIAALIVPLHHRLENWTTKKLVEKNKAIRLAQAKKTIEELEENEQIP